MLFRTIGTSLYVQIGAIELAPMQHIKVADSRNRSCPCPGRPRVTISGIHHLVSLPSSTTREKIARRILGVALPRCLWGRGCTSFASSRSLNKRIPYLISPWSRCTFILCVTICTYSIFPSVRRGKFPAASQSRQGQWRPHGPTTETILSEPSMFCRAAVTS